MKTNFDAVFGVGGGVFGVSGFGRREFGGDLFVDMRFFWRFVGSVTAERVLGHFPFARQGKWWW